MIEDGCHCHHHRYNHQQICPKEKREIFPGAGPEAQQSEEKCVWKHQGEVEKNEIKDEVGEELI